MNLAFALVAAILVGLHRGWVQHEMKDAAHRHHEHGSRLSIKRMIALTSAVVIGGGLIAFTFTGGIG
jgi:hypothetical protein